MKRYVGIFRQWQWRLSYYISAIYETTIVTNHNCHGVSYYQQPDCFFVFCIVFVLFLVFRGGGVKNLFGITKKEK